MTDKLLSEITGLSKSNLQSATATVTDVLRGKTFYAGDKTLKIGNMDSKKEYIASIILEAKGISQVMGWNTSWLSSCSVNSLVFKRSGNVHIVGYIRATGEWYTDYIALNGSYLCYSSGHDGDRSLNTTAYVNSGSTISLLADSGSYLQSVRLFVYEA